MPQPSKTTAAAYSRLTCEGCSIEGKLLCIHTPADLADFLFPAMGVFIPFFAGMIIGKFWVGLAVWIGLAVLFFGYIEALVLCRHCPHYAEEGFLLKCHANAGLPKIPRFDPRPLSRWEQAVWIAYVAVLFLYYIPFFIISEQWLLLVLTFWASLTAAWTVWRTQCNRCYNLSCPVNHVPEGLKKGFFENYPAFARAWGRQAPDTSES